tara:strand:+ start:5030 stop:6139 length:1110 start_codon:yes stop_codon:yes gene_type:complete
MENYSPEYHFKGDVRCDNAPSDNNSLVRKVDVAGLSAIKGIAEGSASFLSLDSEDKLVFASTKLTNVTVDASASSLSNWITNNSTTANTFEAGDCVVLTASGVGETWMCSTNTAGNAATSNFTKIEGPLTAAAIVAKLTEGTGISIAANGTITCDANSDEISEGTTNLYHTTARARGAVSGGVGINYTSSSGEIAVNLTAGTGISISGATIACDANSDEISEGSTNQYHTAARVRAAVSVSGTGLSYDSGTGAFSLSANSDNVGEGTNNLYHTAARAQAAISVESAGYLSYGSGELGINLPKFRKEETVNLTANTWATLNHGLGKKLVQVSVYDASGNKIHLDVQVVNNNSCKIKASANITGAQTVVSI